MKAQINVRERAIGRLRRLLQRKSAARVQMAIIVIVTGIAGILTSGLLLYFGLSLMWLRYGLAVGVAYLVFLFSVWIWLLFHRSRAKSRDVVEGFCDATDLLDLASIDLPGGAGGGSGEAAVDAAGALDLDDLLLVVALVVIAAAAVVASVYVIFIAPSLFAEVLLDGALSVGLYRRLKAVGQPSWVRSVIRKTWLPFFTVIVTFIVAGLVMQVMLPGVDSIGDVLRHLRMLH